VADKKEDLRKTVFSHEEPTWVLLVHEQAEKSGSLSPLVDTIDWFNNSVLARNLVAGTIPLKESATTLIATRGSVPARRLLVLGVPPSAGKPYFEKLSLVISDLEDQAAWVVLDSSLPSAVSKEFSLVGWRKNCRADITTSVG
jgi:hypothetical protein